MRNVVMFCVCLISVTFVFSAKSVSIDYYGVGIDENGDYLEGMLNPNSPYDGLYLGVNPLVQLVKTVGTQDDELDGNDIILEEITIGTWRYTPFHGEWSHSINFDGNVGDPIYVRVFNGPDSSSSTYYGISETKYIEGIYIGPPEANVYDFGIVQTNIPIPEPCSIAIGLISLSLIFGRYRFTR
jgi:hypothetical protein